MIDPTGPIISHDRAGNRESEIEVQTCARVPAKKVVA